MITIRDERPTDIPAREALLDACFGEARHAKTSERLREGRKAADGLSLVLDAWTVVSSAPFGCGTSAPGRAGRRCCSVRSPSIRPCRASASAPS